MDIEWRPITTADVAAWNRLLSEAEAVDRTGEHYDEADLHEELQDPLSGPDDRVGGWDDDTLVAFAGARPREAVTDYWRVDGEGTVAPSCRGQGIGSQGIGWLVDRATALQRERHRDVETRLQITGFPANSQQTALLEGAGFAAVHWSATMRAHLDGEPGSTAGPVPVEWPSGHTLRGYDRSLTTATMAAHNEAFLDHWGFVPWTPAMWEQWVDGTRNACHDQSWVVVTDDRPDHVIGYLLTSEFQAYEQVTGRREAYLAKIGVRREARGRGIAAGLLRHALQSYRVAGFHETSLDVDTSSPTGAFGLYERAGYAVETRTATYELRLPAGDREPSTA